MWNSANLAEGEEVWGAFENRMLIRIFKTKIKSQSWRYRILKSFIICSLTTIIRRFRLRRTGRKQHATRGTEMTISCITIHVLVYCTNTSVFR